MAHIAFFAASFDGHVNPTLGVVAELATRGHRVSYAVPGKFAARVEEAGGRAVRYETSLGAFSTEVAPLGDPDHYTTSALVGVLGSLLRETLATLPALHTAFAADRPDLVVYDPSCWAGRLLAARWGVPTVRSQATFAEGKHWSLARGYTAFRPDPELTRLLRGIARLLARLKVNVTVEEFLAGDNGDPTLVYIPRAFQYAGETFDSRVHFVGPCLRPRGFLGSWRPPRHPGALVLVSLGTVYNRRPEFFRACIQAFSGTRRPVMLAVADLDPASLGTPPPHIEVRSWVPQQEVLPHTGVFVNHAGMGTVMESLAFGVPVVAVPQTAEHRAIADRIVELELGCRLSRDQVGPGPLREAAEAVMGSRRIRARVQRMRRALHAAGGAPAAADAIEVLLGTTPGTSP